MRKQPISLPILLSLLLAIRERGWTFLCVFDATARHYFREQVGTDAESAYLSLLRDHGDWFVEVPARTSADDYILDHAHQTGMPVISNDRYKKYYSTYPWLQSEPDRRIAGVVMSHTIKVVQLGLAVPINRDLVGMLRALNESLLVPS